MLFEGDARWSARIGHRGVSKSALLESVDTEEGLTDFLHQN
jgi:hypothetical protein